MKIYGQTLREVFAKLPWAYKIVVAAGSIFLLFLLIHLPLQLLRPLAAPSKVEPLRITPLGALPAGVLDPSLAYDPKHKAVFMGYAAGSGDLIHVRIARSVDEGCKNWVQTQGGFEAKSDDILAPDGQSVFRAGTWRIETPSLVHDPDDAGREWKLYAYKYFWPADPASRLAIAQHYGMIVYKYAADPAGPWSGEQWLFSPAPDYPPPPYESMILLHLNGLDPSLADITAYSRPSAVYKDGALVMTLSAFVSGGMTPARVIMIVSLDHGSSWRYVGTPLTAAGLSSPYTKLAGASLIEQDGKMYLAAVPGDDARRAAGTLIFGFEDFFKGTLQRDPKTGAPVVLNRLPLQGTAPGLLGGGFAAYHDACPFGMLTGEQTPAAEQGFQIFKTYKKPVSP